MNRQERRAQRSEADQLPEIMNGFQSLAWITWRTVAAVKAFSGDDAAALWAKAMESGLPELGPVTLSPAAAEMTLNAAMTTRSISFKDGEAPWVNKR